MCGFKTKACVVLRPKHVVFIDSYDYTE